VWTRNVEGGGWGGRRLHTIHPLRRWLISSAWTAVSYVCYSSVSILLSTNPCDMYKSSLRHIHDPVLLSQDRNNTFFYLPTDAQEFCFKRNIKIYI
jgi:hypothetical protein